MQEFNSIFIGKQDYIFFPNEILDDLQCLEYKSNSHFAFAVAYYTLITHLLQSQQYVCLASKITVKDIKRYLGYHPESKQLDYIIKSCGLLDSIGYTISSSNHVIKQKVIDNMIMYNNGINDIVKNLTIILMANYKFALSLKSFYRLQQDMDDYNLTGTLYNQQFTIKINMIIFNDIIQHNKLGIIGYLLYILIKKNKELIMSYEQITDYILVNKKVVINVLSELEINNFINIQHGHYVSSKNRNNCNIYSVKK